MKLVFCGDLCSWAAEADWEWQGMRNKDTQAWRHTKLQLGGLHVLGVIQECYLSQSVYFIGQYKEMNQVKIKLQQFLDVKWKEWGLAG
jgi:hypothetical protein